MLINPKVSIVIPVYNGENYLREAIESALSQTYPNIEILVVNDGSTDNGATEAVAYEYLDRISYFKKKNGGVSSALNFGIEKMTGEYFSWLSHDDLYCPEKIQEQIEMLKFLGWPSETIIYSDYANKFEDLNKLSETRLKNTKPETFRYRVAVGNDLHGCTMLIPKAAFDRFGMFNEKMRAVQDYDMWFRLSEYYSFMHIPKVLVTGRVHSQQVGVRLKGLALSENITFRNKCLLSLTKKQITESSGKKEYMALLDIAEVFIQRKIYPVAFSAIRMAFSRAVAESNGSTIFLFPLYFFYFIVRSSALVIYIICRQILVKIKHILVK